MPRSRATEIARYYDDFFSRRQRATIDAAVQGNRGAIIRRFMDAALEVVAAHNEINKYLPKEKPWTAIEVKKVRWLNERNWSPDGRERDYKLPEMNRRDIALIELENATPDVLKLCRDCKIDASAINEFRLGALELDRRYYRDFRACEAALTNLRLHACGEQKLGHALEGGATATHSADFTTVNWFGTRYTFDDGLQAKAMGCLWKEFEKGEHGLSENTIGELIGSSSDRYRLANTFRTATGMHPAWGTMIEKVASGTYRLKKPATTK